MKIVFVGYMASGKSAVAKEVASELKLNLIDLDAYIEEKENCSISDIFKNKGEIYFRQKENLYLNELLDKKESFILSVGGGTPCFAGNMEAIESKSTSIYLRASIVTIYDRLINEKAKRPIVAEIANEDLKEFIAKHLFERAAFYEKSTHVISVNDKSIVEISNEIGEVLNLE